MIFTFQEILTLLYADIVCFLIIKGYFKLAKTDIYFENICYKNNYFAHYTHSFDKNLHKLTRKSESKRRNISQKFELKTLLIYYVNILCDRS